MATKLVDMGVSRKALYSGEVAAAKPESENAKEYPELSLHGPHAEKMGAEDLQEGDEVEQRVRWRVKRHAKTTENGKTEYRMTLCLVKGSDCEECGSEKKAKTDADDGDGADDNDNPGIAYLAGRAAKA